MKFKNPVSVVSPVDGEHATNKEYVDGKMVTKTWTEYQALSEEEKKNGTLYDIPDMPTAGQGGIITTYTHVSQLGLSNGCSVGDVFNALPNNSLAEMACQMQDYADDTTVSYITDLPSPHVLLIIRKHIANSTIRFDITAKLSARDSVTNNFMWIGQLKGSDGTEVTWEKVCTTSVPDVPKTNIDLGADCAEVYQKLSTEPATDNTWFFVKNGWCMVQIDIKCIKEGQGYKRLATSLPKPVSAISNEIGGSGATVVEGEQPLQVTVNELGKVTISGGRISPRYIGTFSYPVAEE